MIAISEPKYHFCYIYPQDNDLQQGDILKKTTEIEAILKEVHPHYLDESYTHFIVLSQTCDLVRRKGKNCKTRYITLGVVRPLSLLLEREIEKHQDSFDRAAIICRKSAKNELNQFLTRLFNNNEPEYFYVEPQPEVGLAEPSCAFLRLSISIRAYQHYDDCLAARIISLTEGFRAKLGWMIGNVYSRVGTEDWVPGTLNKKDFENKISTTLESLCQWVDDEKLKAIKENVLPPNGSIEDLMNSFESVFAEYKSIKYLYDNYCFFNLSIKLKLNYAEDFLQELDQFSSFESSEEVLREMINQQKITTKKDNVVQRIREILRGFNDIEDSRIEKICNRIANDQIINRSIK